MGKACSMITGIGLAGALVGLNIYLLMEPKEQHKIKREVNEAVCEMKKKRKKQELLDDLPDYEVLGLADDEIDLQPALDLLAQRNREE